MANFFLRRPYYPHFHYHARPQDVGRQLAAQAGLFWLKNFNASWKLKDLVAMRLKGKL